MERRRLWGSEVEGRLLLSDDNGAPVVGCCSCAFQFLAAAVVLVVRWCYCGDFAVLENSGNPLCEEKKTNTGCCWKLERIFMSQISLWRGKNVLRVVLTPPSQQ